MENGRKSNLKFGIFVWYAMVRYGWIGKRPQIIVINEYNISTLKMYLNSCLFHTGTYTIDNSMSRKIKPKFSEVKEGVSDITCKVNKNFTNAWHLQKSIKVSYQQSVRYISASEQNPFEMSRSVISSGLMASLSEMFCWNKWIHCNFAQNSIYSHIHIFPLRIMQ